MKWVFFLSLSLSSVDYKRPGSRSTEVSQTRGHWWHVCCRTDRICCGVNLTVTLTALKNAELSTSPVRALKKILSWSKKTWVRKKIGRGSETCWVQRFNFKVGGRELGMFSDGKVSKTTITDQINGTTFAAQKRRSVLLSQKKTIFQKMCT